MGKTFFTIKWWRAPIDIAPLVLFRVAFGLLIACEGFGAIATGWVHGTLIEPAFTFNFIGFEFLQPLPGNGMYVWFCLLGISGIMVMLGWYYRLFMLLYAILWTGVYLMQKTHYNNHYYLAMLLCWLMMLVPANKDFSLDAKFGRVSRAFYCQRWCVWLFITHLWIVYTYAAIAKIYPDWLAADPIGMWFKHKTDYPIIGFVYGWDITKYAVSWGGIVFDALIIPLLIWKRTRNWAFGLSIFFHLFNSITFQIGIFPFLMIGSCVLFYKGETLRRVFNKFLLKANNNSLAKSHPLILYIIYAYLAVQIVLPLRHHYFPGNVNWTEEGHRLSWRMMLRSKSGSLSFEIKNKKTGKTTRLNPTKYLTSDQARAMSKRPDMIWQFVQFLKQQLPKEGITDFEIYARGKMRLNKRKRQNFIKHDYDLVNAEWHWYKSADWLVPLEE